MKGRAMSRVIPILAFTAALSCAAAVVAAAPMDAPTSGAQAGTIGTPATGATGVTPADPPATPNTIPPAVGVYVVPAAIIIGIGAALAGGNGNDPAPFPATGTTGTL
jgi:hypothetical protein